MNTFQRSPAAFLILFAFALSGCESLPFPGLTKAEREVLEFEVQGLKIGDEKQVLARYEGVNKIPGFPGGFEVFEIFNPSPEISTMVAFFANDRLHKIELRYFDGPTARTLSRSGGWIGIRDYLIQKFGPPSRIGNDVELVATQPGIRKEFAKFHGEWIFSRVDRLVNYIALSDNTGGVAVITVMDSRPVAQPQQIMVVETGSTVADASSEQIRQAPAPVTPGF